MLHSFLSLDFSYSLHHFVTLIYTHFISKILINFGDIQRDTCKRHDQNVCVCVSKLLTQNFTKIRLKILPQKIINLYQNPQNTLTYKLLNVHDYKC